ncbi:MAG: molybdenum cofactor biosynthesis protein MoaE, partial [Pseudomonadota bacterium]
MSNAVGLYPFIKIQQADFDLTTENAQLRAGHKDIGAVVSFVGTVRDIN